MGKHSQIAGFSLIEMLVCVAIVAILTGIGFVSYEGSLDSSEIRYTMPEVARWIHEEQDTANRNHAIVRLEFIMGTSKVRETIALPAGPQIKDIDLRVDTLHHRPLSLLKRPLKFRRYEWPDGTKTPTTFTFFPSAKPEGGTVYFGTAFAEAKFHLSGDFVQWDI